MLDVFGFPTPQGANYQEFYGGGTNRDWVKPRGASMVRMLLIGAGGGGSSRTAGPSGGGSGGVTSWVGPAIFVPDTLKIYLGKGGTGGAIGANANGVAGEDSVISYGTYSLIEADNGGAASTVGGTAAAAKANNYFGASGIYTSIAGQAGANAGLNVTASTTTFLCGGAGGSGSTVAAGGKCFGQYGYPDVLSGTGGTGAVGGSGYFLTQPIILSRGGAGGAGSTVDGGSGGDGGIGCGGGGGGYGNTRVGAGGKGGDGAAFIWAW